MGANNDTLNWITEAMAARYLGLSSQRISQLVQDGRFSSEIHLRTRMIWFEDIKKYERNIATRKRKREEKREATEKRKARIAELQK